MVTTTRDIRELIERVHGYLRNWDAEPLQRAWVLACEAHGGQTRASGEAFVEHSLATALILADLKLDAESLIAALLHDVPEDTDVPLERIEKGFGREVAGLVDGVTKLTRIEWGSLEEVEADSLRKMFLAMADDIRVVLIKLADRLHNMRTLLAMPPEHQRKKSQETLEIYAPLAARLGIWQWKWELEDLSLRYLEPQKYQEIADRLNERRAKREEDIAGVVEILRQRLAEEGIRAEIIGRPKHLYSIYQKMDRKGVDFDQIYDVRAVRVVVDTVKDCYAVLGTVHSLWHPIPREFDDYIAKPKENMYQSLHTAVVGPEGKALEVQIRTHEMHHVSEYGIAAHWRYKAPGRADVAVEHRINWLRQVMEWRQDLLDAEEFVDSLKTDLFPERVYIFTPKGDIVDLPAGATSLDFAYRIHTDVGHLCRGAKINGRLMSLDTKLQDGDQVEIITHKKGGPSRDWLNPNLGYVATSRARQKIRLWFKKQDRTENITQGRAILEKELRRLGLEEKSFDEVARLLKFEKVDDLLASIGYGDINAHQIATRLLELEQAAEAELPSHVTPPRVEAPAGITVQGTEGLLTRLARCCNPVPGDAIVGFITRGRGVTVHRRECRQVLRQNGGERVIQVDWGRSLTEVYPVVIKIRAYDRAGLVRDVAQIVADEKVSMASAAAETSSDHTATITATLQISNVEKLSRILTRLERLPNVFEVTRQLG